jgi:hypothetical protein
MLQYTLLLSVIIFELCHQTGPRQTSQLIV